MTLGDAGIVIDGEEGPKGEAGTPGRFGYDGLPGKFVEIRKKIFELNVDSQTEKNLIDMAFLIVN